MISHYRTHAAYQLLQTPPDGSEANKQARASARNALVETARAMEELASDNQTPAALYLKDHAALLRYAANRSARLDPK